MEYKMANEFVIPNLMLEETPKPEIGKYGSMRKKFLAEEAPILYEMMQMEGTLYPHLAEINSAVNRQIEQTVQLLMQQTAAPDRKTDPLGWTQWMNALKAQADTLLAQRDLTAEVAALKDRLAASEQRAAVAEAKVEVMTQMRGE